MQLRTCIGFLAVALLGMSSGEPLPARLADTGLEGATPFAPHYPLWTDGQAKRRWIHIPAGTSIDTSNPDAWEFPRGTKAWKEFTGPGGRIETRMIERLADGSWRFAAYAWNAEGTEATLAPEEGIPARGIPSRADCLACHEGAPVPILGYSAVQLEGRVADPVLGYLHGNCGHCHNANALPSAGLHFAQSAADPQRSAQRARESLEGRASAVLARMNSHNPYYRMPPLGVRIADAQAIAAIERWKESH